MNNIPNTRPKITAPKRHILAAIAALEEQGECALDGKGNCQNYVHGSGNRCIVGHMMDIKDARTTPNTAYYEIIDAGYLPGLEGHFALLDKLQKKHDRAGEDFLAKISDMKRLVEQYNFNRYGFRS